MAKILSDSVSVGPIYPSHLKNQKSRCRVQTFWTGTFEKKIALKNLKKLEKIRKKIGEQKYFRIRFLPVQFTYYN